jgi:hypothetical protein
LIDDPVSACEQASSVIGVVEIHLVFNKLGVQKNAKKWDFSVHGKETKLKA